ncbi:MAG: TolC family protein [Ignavibacteriota bacterium]
MKKLILIAPILPSLVFAQTALTWQQVRDKFEASNPTLKAAQTNIDEARAGEITANLRPNPTLTTTFDQLNPFADANSPNTGTPGYRPFAYALPFASIGYLHERDHKRELRLASARKSTDVAADTYSDQERTLLFNLRNAFVQTLQAKAVQQNARENLEYWDRELDVNRRRFGAGDLAQVDLDRLELQRVQFESDLEMATVNLRTAKIQVLGLLNDRTPIDRFDVTGPFDFVDRLSPVEEYRQAALASRPDLRVARDTVELARANHQLAVANGSTDPTFSVDFARNPPIPVYFASVFRSLCAFSIGIRANGRVPRWRWAGPNTRATRRRLKSSAT